MQQSDVITVGELRAAVSAWEADVRANRADFDNDEICRTRPLSEQVDGVVGQILKYVEEGRGGAGTPQGGVDGSPLEG